MEIPLSNSSLLATIDEETYLSLNGRECLLSAEGYVLVKGAGPLHRLIMGAAKVGKTHIHHKDGNKLNNMKSNLCRVSHNSHSAISNRERLGQLRAWATSHGIKDADKMFIYELGTLKTRYEKQSAEMELELNR